MDHETMPCGGPQLGMYASDRDVFDRVWRRVMPEERADCPITTRPAAGESVHTPSPISTPAQALIFVPAPGTQAGTDHAPDMGECPCSGEQAPPAPTPQPGEEAEAALEMTGDDLGSEPAPWLAQTVPAPMGAPEEDAMPAAQCHPPETDAAPAGQETQAEAPPPESLDHTGDDFPREDAVPCLGSGSAGHGGQLQEDIMALLEGWQLYRHLARRVTGASARSLSALASEKHRQARRLAAAYFLISGVRYWPTDRLGVPRTGSWLGALRRRFTVEQQMDSRFRAAALDTEDGCLADLYRELADICAAQAGVLRMLLENAL